MAGRLLDVLSPSNPRVKSLVDLRKRRTRDRLGVVVVEGYEECELARSAGAELRELYVCAELMAEARRPVLDAVAHEVRDSGANVVRLARAAFEKASIRESPDGWLAVVHDPTRDLADVRVPSDALVLVCEGVEKPGNLGAMLRTADAAGVDLVIACDPGTDWGNPNVVRASKGAVFAVPVATATSADTIDWLRAHAISVVVATPEAIDVPSGADLSGPSAVVVGAEHEGVTDAWRSSADRLVTIPMFGQVNSLNVATSAALVLYEAVRQRQGTTPSA